MLTSVATSWAVPTRIAPPVPVYGPSVPSRTTTKSISGSPASGLLTPGYSRPGPQVDVVVELKAQPQQQTSLEHPAGHRRIADRAQQDRVVRPQFGNHRIRQHLAGGVKSPGPQVVFGLLDAGQNCVENCDRFSNDLRPDPVTRNDREFHDRSTTSSLLAATADLISERTSAGRRGPPAAGSSRPVPRRPRRAERPGCSRPQCRAACRSCPVPQADRRS